MPGLLVIYLQNPQEDEIGRLLNVHSLMGSTIFKSRCCEVNHQLWKKGGSGCCSQQEGSVHWWFKDTELFSTPQLSNVSGISTECSVQVDSWIPNVL